MMMNTTQIEQHIVSMIIDSILTSGYTLRIHDGESWASSVHDNRDEHLASIMATDEESIVVFDPATKKRVGSIFLVYGNDGYDVINDHSAKVEIEDILSEVYAWINDNEE